MLDSISSRKLKDTLVKNPTPVTIYEIQMPMKCYLLIYSNKFCIEVRLISFRFMEMYKMLCSVVVS